MACVDQESSEARAFKRKFSFLCSTIGPELRAIASELYAKSMISDNTRDRAYAQGGRVEEFLVDIECKIRTDPAYFHGFINVLDTKESLRDLASHLAAEHRRLSMPTTTAEKRAMYRSGLEQDSSTEELVHTSVPKMIVASCSSLAGLVDSGSETEKSGLFSRNQEQECSPQSESVRLPVAETNEHSSHSSTQVASGLDDSLRYVKNYLASHYVERQEAESHAKQVDELSLKLKGMKIELDEKDKAIANFKAENNQLKEDTLYYARKCRTLETEREELGCKVDNLEKQYKEQASVLARARAALITRQPCCPCKAKSHGRCKSWPQDASK